MPNEDKPLTVSDEIDILTGLVEAPSDPRFEEVPDVPPFDPEDMGGQPVAPAEPAPEEPPSSDAGEEPTPPTAPEEPSLAPDPVQPESPPSPPAEDQEKLALQGQIAALQAQLNELLDKGFGATPPAEPKPPQPPPVAPEPTPQVPPVAKQFVQTEEEFDQIISSVDNFNQFIGKVVEAAQSGAVERAYTSLPNVVMQMVQRQLTFGALVRDFYKENEDLLPHAKFAGFVMNELANQEPDLEIGALMRKTGEEVRKRLGLAPKSAVPSGPRTAAPVRTKSPAFAAGPGTRKVAPPQLAGLEKEINDLLD